MAGKQHPPHGAVCRAGLVLVDFGEPVPWEASLPKDGQLANGTLGATFEPVRVDSRGDRSTDLASRVQDRRRTISGV